MSKDNNIFIILGAICIFHLFGKHTITELSTGIVIRYLATYEFPIYLLNIFLIDHIEPYNIEYHNSPVFLLYYFVAQCIILVLSFVIELSRRLLMNSFINTLSKHIDNWAKEWLQKKMPTI